MFYNFRMLDSEIAEPKYRSAELCRSARTWSSWGLRALQALLDDSPMTVHYVWVWFYLFAQYIIYTIRLFNMICVFLLCYFGHFCPSKKKASSLVRLSAVSISCAPSKFGISSVSLLCLWLLEPTKGKKLLVSVSYVAFLCNSKSSNHVRT